MRFTVRVSKDTFEGLQKLALKERRPTAYQAEAELDKAVARAVKRGAIPPPRQRHDDDAK